MLEKLLGVGEKVFTVTFNKKVDNEHIINVLSTAPKSDSDLRKVAK